MKEQGHFDHAQKRRYWISCTWLCICIDLAHARNSTRYSESTANAYLLAFGQSWLVSSSRNLESVPSITEHARNIHHGFRVFASECELILFMSLRSVLRFGDCG